ncbi:MAG: TonB-dependent receptor, partial [Sphingomicrobium sp.]
VDYDNTVGPIPSIQTNVDLNNPANFGWTGGRLNIQDERRRTYTKGVRGSAVWGDPHLNLHVGSAYDIVYRRIRGFDASQQWQNAVCGNNPSVFLPGPNGQPSCQGLNQPGAAPAGYPSYPAYGTGYTAGQAGPVTYAGSLIPSGAPLQGFLRPGPNGYITVDWDAFRKASNYDAFHDAAPETGGANTGASGGALREKTWGIFGEVNGDMDVGGNRLVYNAGMRWVKSNQSIGGRVSIPDPRNSTDPDGAGPLPTACPGGGANLRDGSCYPNIINFVYTEQSYTNWLPSASAAYHIGDHAVVRAALSKTMTRPNPANMLPGLNFSSPSADQGSVGNPALEPYLSKNIDLGFEYYTGSEGYFGLAAFRKSIQGFTENRNSPPLPFSTLAQYGVTYDTLSPTQRSAIDARGGPGAATVILTQQTNVPGKLNINGLEFTWVQPLDFLLGRFGLNGFGFNANLTIVDQSGSGSAAGLAVATGVPPRSRNITGYYENHGVSLRLSNTFSKGFQASGPGQNGISAAALFTDDYHQWDFAGSLELSKILGMRSLPDLTLDVQNITKEAQRSYFQFPNAAFTYYKPGRIVMAGIRGKF